MPSNESLIEELSLSLMRNMTGTALLHQALADRAGLHPTDAHCVTTLVLDGPQAPGQLAHFLGISTGGAITAVIDRLEKAGIVRRIRDDGDRRRVIIEPIPENTIVATYLEPYRSTFAKELAELPEEGLAFLLDWLRRTNAVLTQAITETRELPDR